MDGQTLTTYTLSDADLEQAVKEFIAKERGHRVEAQTVKIKVDPGSPYYNQFDQGTPAKVTVTSEVKG